MRVVNFVLRVLGWLVIVIFQIAVSFLVIFLFSVVFAGVDTTSRLGWLALLFFIWLGYVIGVNLVGDAYLRWVQKSLPLLPILRLLGTMIGAIIPLLILLPIGFSVPVGDAGSSFSTLVTNDWQPVLAQAALFTAILGYYLPGMLVRKKPQTVGDTEMS